MATQMSLSNGLWRDRQCGGAPVQADVPRLHLLLWAAWGCLQLWARMTCRRQLLSRRQAWDERVVKELSWTGAADVMVRETTGLCSSACMLYLWTSARKRYRGKRRETVASTVWYLVQAAISNCPMSASRLADHSGWQGWRATLPVRERRGLLGVSI